MTIDRTYWYRRLFLVTCLIGVVFLLIKDTQGRHQVAEVRDRADKPTVPASQVNSSLLQALRAARNLPAQGMAVVVGQRWQSGSGMAVVPQGTANAAFPSPFSDLVHGAPKSVDEKLSFRAWRNGSADFSRAYFEKLDGERALVFITAARLIEAKQIPDRELDPVSGIYQRMRNEGTQPTCDDFISACSALNKSASFDGDTFCYNVARSFTASPEDREFLAYVASNIPGTSALDRIADAHQTQMAESLSERERAEAEARVTRFAPLALLGATSQQILNSVIAIALAGSPAPTGVN